MSGYACYACHGLGILQPIDELASWLNANTPVGIHFVTIGGIDPMLEEKSIRETLAADVAAGRQIILVSHSKGAMLGYYLDMAMPLCVTIDPTCWGSNIRTPEWGVASFANAGMWRARDNVTEWLNFRQSIYPGGGVLANPGPTRKEFFYPDCNHMSIVTDMRTRIKIRSAVLDVLSRNEKIP